MKSILVAMGEENQVIGANNSLPAWKLSADMQRFKELTTGQIVVMGRKTYESLPPKFRPLPNRQNIVVSRNPDYRLEGCITCNSLSSALEVANTIAEREEKEVFVIGGGEIYRQAMEYVDRIYLTMVHGFFEGDVFFSEIDHGKWMVVEKDHRDADEKNSHAHSFLVLERKK